MFIVEILSAKTGRYDKGSKLADYLLPASDVHFLFIDPDASLIIHQERRGESEILTHILGEGAVRLDPPGF